MTLRWWHTYSFTSASCFFCLFVCTLYRVWGGGRRGCPSQFWLLHLCKFTLKEICACGLKQKKLRKQNRTVVGHSRAEFQLTIKRTKNINTHFIDFYQRVRETLYFLSIMDQTIHVRSQNAFASDYSEFYLYFFLIYLLLTAFPGY